MNVGDRLRQLREVKSLSQGDIEKRTGLLRCYVSRVENGHTVPAVETLEKFARALEVPLYQLLYEGEDPPADPRPRLREFPDWASQGKGKRLFTKLRWAIGQISAPDRVLLLYMAAKMSRKKRRT